jgi:hypothetical protein
MKPRIDKDPDYDGYSSEYESDGDETDPEFDNLGEEFSNEELKEEPQAIAPQPKTEPSAPAAFQAGKSSNILVNDNKRRDPKNDLRQGEFPVSPQKFKATHKDEPKEEHSKSKLERQQPADLVNQEYDYYEAEANALISYCYDELEEKTDPTQDSKDSDNESIYIEKNARNKKIDQELDDLFEKFRLRMNRIKPQIFQEVKDCFSLLDSAQDIRNALDIFKFEYLYFSEQVKKYNQGKKKTHDNTFPRYVPLNKIEKQNYPIIEQYIPDTPGERKFHDLGESISFIIDQGSQIERKSSQNFPADVREETALQELKERDAKEHRDNTRGNFITLLGTFALIAGGIGCAGVFTAIIGVPLLALGAILCGYGMNKSGNSTLSYAVATKLSSPLKSHPVETRYIKAAQANKKILAHKHQATKSSSATIMTSATDQPGYEQKHSQSSKASQQSIQYHPHMTVEEKLEYLSPHVKFPRKLEDDNKRIEQLNADLNTLEILLYEPEKKNGRQLNPAVPRDLIDNPEKSENIAQLEQIKARKTEEKKAMLAFAREMGKPSLSYEQKLHRAQLAFNISLEMTLHDSLITDAEKLARLSQFIKFPSKLTAMEDILLHKKQLTKEQITDLSQLVTSPSDLLKKAKKNASPLDQNEQKQVRQEIQQGLFTQKLAFLLKLFPAKPSHHPQLTEEDLSEQRQTITFFLNREKRREDIILEGRPKRTPR